MKPEAPQTTESREWIEPLILWQQVAYNKLWRLCVCDERLVLQSIPWEGSVASSERRYAWKICHSESSE